jgi:hypothetical protein
MLFESYLRFSGLENIVDDLKLLMYSESSRWSEATSKLVLCIYMQWNMFQIVFCCRCWWEIQLSILFCILVYYLLFIGLFTTLLWLPCYLVY